MQLLSVSQTATRQLHLSTRPCRPTCSVCSCMQIDAYIEALQQEYDAVQDGKLTNSKTSDGRGRLIQGESIPHLCVTFTVVLSWVCGLEPQTGFRQLTPCPAMITSAAAAAAALPNVCTCRRRG